MSENAAYFSADCLDDLLRDAIEALLAEGREVTARRGSCKELIGVMLHLRDPQARLSRTETRGRLFSAIGEFCWYMSGRGDLASIEYYLPRYREDAEQGILCGAYGPRLVGDRDGNQLAQIVRLLRDHPTSRRAAIRLFDAEDLRTGQRDVPCTCILQYFIRNKQLDSVTYMRSNDVYLGLPHDVFCFTLLQEYLARCLGVELGRYKHVVGSLHLYSEHQEAASQYLGEGFQSTEHPMPPMPVTEPAPSLATLLEAEAKLRAPSIDWDAVDRLVAAVETYWGDLIRLLCAYSHYKIGKKSGVPAVEPILKVRSAIASKVYSPFVDRLVERLRC